MIHIEVSVVTGDNDCHGAAKTVAKLHPITTKAEARAELNRLFDAAWAITAATRQEKAGAD